MEAVVGLFLKYLLEEGKFNPSNYEGILELGQSAPNSLSRCLRDFNQYLLSKKVIYEELDSLGLNGAYGYLEQGIFVPKSLRNDKHFIEDAPKVPYIRQGYSYPSIEEFGSIICEGISSDLFDISSYSQDVFVGYCASTNNEEELCNNRIFFDKLFTAVNIASGREFEIKRDIDSKLEKEFCLIKRKKKCQLH